MVLLARASLQAIVMYGRAPIGSSSFTENVMAQNGPQHRSAMTTARYVSK